MNCTCSFLRRTGDLPNGKAIQLTKGDQFCFYEKTPSSTLAAGQQVKRSDNVLVSFF